MNLSTINTLLFDLGGVVLNIAPQKTIEAFTKLGLTDIQNQITHGHHSGLFKAFEQGSITETEFILEIRKEILTEATDQEIIQAWNAMLLDMPIQRVQIIEKLKEKYRVYLLSNTNSIHRSCFDTSARAYDKLSQLFHQVYYSYELKVSKPDKRAFEKVIEASGLTPATTLFLDDSPQNIETAKAMGFQTVLISDEFGMEQVFNTEVDPKTASE